MSSVKETINNFLVLLQNFGFSVLRAETFRLAKFNDSEICQPMWRLLFEAIYFIKLGYINQMCSKAFNEYSSSEIVVFIKKKISGYGYVSETFDMLPDDMSEGSQELLLAFGWLTCKENLIGRLYLQAIVSSYEFEETSRLLHKIPSDYLVQISNHESKETLMRLKQMVWVNGKLHASLYNLKSARYEHFKVVSHVHTATSGSKCEPSKPHLSLNEVYLLSHPEKLKKYVHELETYNKKLGLLVQWQDCENEFWKWMGSVLDARSIDSTNQEHSRSDMSECAIYTLSEVHKKLHNMLMKYEVIATELERHWEERSRSVHSSEINSLILAIDSEINLFSQGLLVTESKLNRERFICKKEKHYALGKCTYINIEKEICKLNALLSKLRSDTTCNISILSSQLQTLGELINSMILFDVAT